MSDYAIEIRNYNLSIKTASSEIRLLSDISATINAGQVTAITGPSGAGKSLLTRAIMQLFYGEDNFLQSGEILLCGQGVFGNGAISEEPWRGRRIAMIFQNPSSAFNPVKKCKDQIIEAWQVCNPNRIDEGIIQLDYWLKKMDLLDLPHIKEAYPHQLSGGQLQRLMFIMAVINKPECIIADEPTTALDIWYTAEQLKLWKSICIEHHITLILITHDLSLVKHLADQILFLQGGKLLYQANKETFFNKCPNIKVSKFVEDYFYFEKNIWNKSENKTKTANNVICVDRLSKTYRDNYSWIKSKSRNILSEISFTLKDGSILGITGASGSGKTTLLLSILKLTEINAGKLFWNNMDVTEMFETELRSKRNKFQIVFQDAYKSLPYFMTVSQVMVEACRAAGIVKYDERIYAMLDKVQLEKNLLSRHISQLSGGELQRLSLARTLVMSPDLIILDEPFSSMDPSLQKQMVELICRYHQENNCGIILVSHNIPLIKYLVDNILVLDVGRVTDLGPVDEVILQPSQPFKRLLNTFVN